MIDSAIAWITNFQWNGTLGILLYWVPIGFCAFGYTLRTAKNYTDDKKKRESKEHSLYTPTDTIGDLIGRGIVSVIPVCNLWAAMFDLAPDIFGNFFTMIGKVFNAPLVPDSDSFKTKRKQ